MNKRDKQWISDMYREVEGEVMSKPDPARSRSMCKCGHPLSKHYQGTRAMPCSLCKCDYCRCEFAESLRRDKARRGVQDITPHPEFERRRK